MNQTKHIGYVIYKQQDVIPVLQKIKASDFSDHHYILVVDIPNDDSITAAAIENALANAEIRKLAPELEHIQVIKIKQGKGFASKYIFSHEELEVALVLNDPLTYPLTTLVFPTRYNNGVLYKQLLRAAKVRVYEEKIQDSELYRVNEIIECEYYMLKYDLQRKVTTRNALTG